MSDGDEFGENSSALARFRTAVIREFGSGLEKATPANVREFLDNYQEKAEPGFVRGRLELNESKTTYEEILKDFFASVLERPTDEALILLWTLSFEMSFYMIEQHAAERLQALFGEVGEQG